MVMSTLKKVTIVVMVNHICKHSAVTLHILLKADEQCRVASAVLRTGKAQSGLAFW